MRLTPLKTGNVVELDAYHQISPRLAEQQAKAWDREYWAWLHSQGLAGYAGWDNLPPQTRQQLLQIYDQGFDNVTRRKIGLTELE